MCQANGRQDFSLDLEAMRRTEGRERRASMASQTRQLHSLVLGGDEGTKKVREEEAAVAKATDEPV